MAASFWLTPFMVRGVAMKAGAMLLQRMPWRPYSTAIC
jgi:hypothetical protein